MRLHEDKKLFGRAVSNTASYFKVDPSIVEKDYYVTLFLEELANRLPKLLFKGGTSLSKCHKLINRFSEDIDLTLEEDPITQGQKKKVKQAIKDVCDELQMILLNEADTRSRRDFNRYEIDYSPGCPAVAIKPILLVETTFIVKSYPSEEKMATSMIYDYMVSINQEAFAVQYGLEPFPILVQTLDRTLIDKVFALCDYYLTDRVAEHSRHLYDISKLLDVVSLDAGFAKLFQRVRVDRQFGNSQCVSADSQYSITALLKEILEKDVYKTDYENITSHVLYESVTYDRAVMGIEELIHSGLLG